MSEEMRALLLIDELERLGAKVDALLSDGTHRYWSTHCRHGDHEACAATEMVGLDVVGDGFRPRMARKPAQCKHCGSPCICPNCDHGSPVGSSAVSDGR